MANLNWTTKTNDVDDVLAEDFNNLVANIETELEKKVDKVTGKGLIDTDVADNISIKNYGANDVFTVATPEVDFKFVNAETINIPTADDIHWGTNTTLHTELDKKVDKEDGKGLSAVSDVSILGGGTIGITPPDNWKSIMITKTNGTIENVDFYNKDQMKEKLNNKADKATTLSGYGITDAYTKTEVEAYINEAILGGAW